MSNDFESKYEVIEKIGEGSFSEVLKVEDRITKLQYAAKKLKKRFKNKHDILHCAEIIATQKLCRHPNVLYMLEHIYDSFGGKVIFIFELMDMSMYEYMKLKKRLFEAKVKTYLYQILKGLEHLHNNGLFHRDIKPENILVKLPPYNQESSIFGGELVKLADLGSIRGIYSQPPYTEYISTRWYRSPECLLTIGNYGPKMDVWAVGCVFYEMLTMKPLFPGLTEIDQLSRIHALLGTPSNRLLCKFKKRSKNFENFPYQAASGLRPLLCNVTEDTQYLLKLMLQYDPETRSNVRRLLENKYFDKMREDDLFRRYKAADVKTRLFKKGNGDQEYLHYIGYLYNWKNKFQNTVHGGSFPLSNRPPPNTPPPTVNDKIKEQISCTTEHAATTGNLRADYNFPISKHKSLRQQHAVKQSHQTILQHQQKQQYNNYPCSGINHVHALPLTKDQIVLGQHNNGGGYSYGYGPPGMQGARPPLGVLKRRRKPVPGALYSRTTVELPIISHHQLQRPSPSMHHQSNTISSMMKKKPPVSNQQYQPHNNYNTNNENRRLADYRQNTKRDRSKGSKVKVKSINSSMTEINGKGAVSLDGIRIPEYHGGHRQYRDRLPRSISTQRLVVSGKLVRLGKQLHMSGGAAAAARNAMGGDAQVRARVSDVADMKKLRKRAASKSPQAVTPSKQFGTSYKNQRRMPQSISVGRWSELKRQSGVCHKQLDVAPCLPVCQMNVGGQLNPGGGTLYKGIASNPGVFGHAGDNIFRKTTSNLPQLIKKPLLHQPYDNPKRKTEFQSRSFVMPNRQQGRLKLDTIVEFKGRGSRKFA